MSASFIPVIDLAGVRTHEPARAVHLTANTRHDSFKMWELFIVQEVTE